MTRLLDIIRNPLGKPLLEALASSTDQFAAVLKLDSALAANEEEGKGEFSAHAVSKEHIISLRIMKNERVPY